MGVVVETPTDDLTVFKVHYGKMILKIYTKGERVAWRVKYLSLSSTKFKYVSPPPCLDQTV
jgi:hypothetical protein